MNRTNNFCKIIATGFGSGYSPVAPGTAGALLAVAIWIVLSVALPPVTLAGTTAFLIVVFTLLGVWSGGKMEDLWGKDPSRVVVDEMVGVWIPLLAASDGNWCHAAIAFVAFRLFDIFKPLGIRRMENIRGGWGIMLDDILAGVYSLLLLCIIRWFVG